MTYKELQDKVSDIFDKAETEMNDVIEKFNENFDYEDDLIFKFYKLRSRNVILQNAYKSINFSELKNFHWEDYS